MRRLVMGVVFGAGLMMMASGAFSTPRLGDLGVPPLADQGLIALPSQVADGRQQLTVIDPTLRTVAIYHINTANGEMTLRSVRNINWDLHMSQYNGVSPLPQQIRSMLDER
ncbi:MAG: hypothetical protein WBF93_04895 [Pirellulales bacterium]